MKLFSESADFRTFSVVLKKLIELFFSFIFPKTESAFELNLELNLEYN